MFNLKLIPVLNFINFIITINPFIKKLSYQISVNNQFWSFIIVNFQNYLYIF